MLAGASVSFWRRCTTKSGCIRRWAIVRRCSSRTRQRRRRQRGSRHEDSTQGRRERAITSLCARQCAGKREWLRVPARRVRGCGGDTPPDARADGGNLDCPRAEWPRPLERRFHAAAVPWRSTYRQCSNPVAGSVLECATGTTNRHRRQWLADGPARQRAGAREKLLPAAEESEAANRRWPPEPIRRLAPPTPPERTAP